MICSIPVNNASRCVNDGFLTSVQPEDVVLNGGMDNTAAVSPDFSLSALRGAVGGVVGAADAVGCWDRLVSIWRIFWALDGLMAVLWAIVDRLRAGEMSLGLGCPAGAVSDERPVAAGLRPVRLRAVAGVRAVAGRRVRRFSRPRVDWERQERVLGGVSAVLAVRCRWFSELGWGAARSCVLFVPV
jgi:hypothetical protein